MASDRPEIKSYYFDLTLLLPTALVEELSAWADEYDLTLNQLLARVLSGAVPDRHRTVFSHGPHRHIPGALTKPN